MHQARLRTSNTRIILWEYIIKYTINTLINQSFLKVEDIYPVCHDRDFDGA